LTDFSKRHCKLSCIKRCVCLSVRVISTCIISEKYPRYVRKLVSELTIICLYWFIWKRKQMQLKWPNKLVFNPEDRVGRFFRNVRNDSTVFVYLVNIKIKKKYKTSEV